MDQTKKASKAGKPTRRSRKRNLEKQPPLAERLPRAYGTITRATRNATTAVHKRRERIATINGSVSLAYPFVGEFNPGNEQMFPWLSGIANHYDRYRVEQAKLIYVPTAGTDVDGTVTIHFDPDVIDGPPTSVEEASQSAHYVTTSSWREVSLVIPGRGTLFTKSRGQVIPISTDLKTYDLGMVSVLTQGQANSNAIGYLEMEYVVHLLDAQANQVGRAHALDPITVFDFGTDYNLNTTPTGLYQIMSTGGFSHTDRDITFNPVTATFSIAKGGWKIECYAVHQYTGHSSQNPTVLFRMGISGADHIAPATQSTAILREENLASGRVMTFNTVCTQYVQSSPDPEVDMTIGLYYDILTPGISGLANGVVFKADYIGTGGYVAQNSYVVFTRLTH